MKSKKEQIEDKKVVQGQVSTPQQQQNAQQISQLLNNISIRLTNIEIETRKNSASIEISDKDRTLLWKEFHFLEKQLE